MEVRPREDSDLDACEELARLVLDIDGYPPRRPGNSGRFLVAPGALGAWVVDNDGAIIGHVALHRSSSAEVFALASQATGQPTQRLAVVARLLVSPEHRRRGVARLLLTAATGAAHRRGLWPVLDVAAHFRAAIALYGRSGWTCVGQVTFTIAGAEPLDELVFIGPAPGPSAVQIDRR